MVLKSWVFLSFFSLLVLSVTERHIQSIMTFGVPFFGLCVGASLLGPWDFTGKNTGVGCHSFFQGIFPTLGLNLHLLCLLHCRQILYHLNYREAPLGCLFLFNPVKFCFIFVKLCYEGQLNLELLLGGLSFFIMSCSSLF